MVNFFYGVNMKHKKTSVNRGSAKGTLAEQLAERVTKIAEATDIGRSSIRYVNPNFIDRSPVGETEAPYLGEGEIHTTLLGWTAR